PEPSALPGTVERLVYCGKPLGDEAHAAQRVRHFAEKWIVTGMERGLGELTERRAQHVQSPTRVATPEQQDTLEAATVRMPEGQAMPFGILEQHRHDALRGRKIACRTSPLFMRSTHRPQSARRR